jgi:nitroreductase
MIYKLYKRIKLLFEKIKLLIQIWNADLLDDLLFEYVRQVKYTHNGNLEKIDERYLLTFLNIFYHSIEKGFSAPKIKTSFGLEKIRFLLNSIKIIDKIQFENNKAIYNSTLNVLNNYVELDKENNGDLFFLEDINQLLGDFNFEKRKSNIPYNVPIEKDFRENMKFSELLLSRHSVRNFSKKTVSNDNIQLALNRAVICPSSCNRNPWNIYLFSNSSRIKEIIDLQGGCAGFSEIPRLMVITYDKSFYHNSIEKNLGYIDSGIFIMNLVYSLFLEGLDSCILNNAFNRKKNISMRKLIPEIMENEDFTVFLAVGYRNEICNVPFSEKNKIKMTII